MYSTLKFTQPVCFICPQGAHQKRMTRPTVVHKCTCCKSIMFLCLLLPVLLRSEPAHSFVLQHKHSTAASGSKVSDLADLKLPSSWLSNISGGKRNNLDKQSHLPLAVKTEEEEFNQDGLGDVDNSSKDSDDVKQFQSSHGFELGDIKADSLLALTDNPNSSKETESVVELDRLIGEITEESQKEKEANQLDNSFEQAEAIKAKLDFEINRTRLILMRLRSLQRNVADAHFLAKKLVESDVVSKYIKDYAVTNLDKSVEKVKKVLVKM